MWKVGITGGIACGKSTVSQFLREWGYPVIDADVAARKVVAKGMPALEEIITTFGIDMRLDNGELNRPALAKIIFHDEEKRQQLNKMLHPIIRDQMLTEMEQLDTEIAFFDIPLLLESKSFQFVDSIWVIFTDEETQLARLMSRNQLSQAEALARIQAQIPLQQQLAQADETINNSGTKAETKKQLEILLKQTIQQQRL